MELHIEKDTSVKDVQEKFNAFYPFLQLQFYKASRAGNKRQETVDPKHRIQQLSLVSNPHKIVITPQTTVAQLLHDLKEIGLIAQVCRKSGNLWIKTCLTDDWTLERQNREAILVHGTG